MASAYAPVRRDPARSALDRLRRHPRGHLRHYASLLALDAAAGAPLLLERAPAQRIERLRAAVADALHERRSPSRRRMRALQAAPGGRLCFKDVPAPPSPGPHGAIVHPIAVTTCDIDCPIALGKLQFPLPLHLGHECVADVVSVGERVSAVAAGDRVLVPFQISCGACAACRAGRTGNCESVPPVSMYGMGVLAGHWGGAISDELAVPYADAMLVPLPAQIDPAAAASVADNICDAYRHIAPHLPRLLEEDPATQVLVLGAMSRGVLFSSSMPLYVGLIARAFGAHNVCVADVKPDVRRLAERLGLEAAHPRELRRRPRARLVVDESAGRLSVAVSRTAPDGICTSSGALHRHSRLPALAMYVRNVTVHVGRAHVRALIPEVLEMIRAGRLRPETVITNRAALDDAPSALREHCAAGTIKTVLTA